MMRNSTRHVSRPIWRSQTEFCMHGIQFFAAFPAAISVKLVRGGAISKKNQHHHSGSKSMPVQVGQVSHVAICLVDKLIGSLDSHRQPGVNATGPCSELASGNF